MTAARDNKLDVQTDREALIARFVRLGAAYYSASFDKLDATRRPSPQFNVAAALLGTFWWAARHMWLQFWLFLILETIALVKIFQGLFGELGKAEFARAARLGDSAVSRRVEADEAAASGADNAAALERSAEALEIAAAKALMKAEEMAAGGTILFLSGLVILVIAKCSQGFWANSAMKARFQRWRADPTMAAGISRSTLGLMSAFVVFTWILSILRFVFPDRNMWLHDFPASTDLRRKLEGVLDDGFQWLTENLANLFMGITRAIRTLLDGMETLLVGTPWPIVMAAIVLLAHRIAGIRVAIFTVAALAYLAFLGFWKQSMVTVALLGSACVICLIIGIPLGVWCARNRRVRAVVWPVLDLMQTMPSFVYLIPVIAFFGIGKPPGIIATIIFGMPPVVRLTVLGFDGIPASVREAAMSFGVSKAYMLFRVDLPLARPSIMAGVNQTILMCLSMVVIASLIGAKGLGEDVLDALTYANEGKGVLAGIAILLCAMILDRIVQGKVPKN